MVQRRRSIGLHTGLTGILPRATAVLGLEYRQSPTETMTPSAPIREGTMHLRPHIVVIFATGVLLGAAGLAQACPRHGAAAASRSVTAARGADRKSTRLN